MEKIKPKKIVKMEFHPTGQDGKKSTFLELQFLTKQENPYNSSTKQTTLREWVCRPYSSQNEKACHVKETFNAALAISLTCGDTQFQPAPIVRKEYATSALSHCLSSTCYINKHHRGKTKVPIW